MRSSFRLLAMVGAILCAMLTSGPVSAADVEWDQYDVTITVHEDGTMTVVEDQVVAFNGYFSSGFASIPLARVEDIDNVQVWVGESEASLEEAEYVRRNRYAERPATYTLYESSGNLEIEYSFLSTAGFSEESRYIRISYDVQGGIRVYPDLVPANQQIWWIAIASEVLEIAPVNNATVTLILPESVDPSELILEPSNGQIDGNTITWTRSSMDQGDSFEIRAQFPMITSATVPEWQATDDRLREEQEEQEERKSLAGTFLFGAGSLLAIAGGLGVAGLWYVRGRDPHVGAVAEYTADPPDDIGPGAAGVLIDEQVQARDIIATIVDLLNRKVLKLDGQDAPQFKSGMDLELLEHTETLRPYESALLKVLFPGKEKKTELGLRLQTIRGLSSAVNNSYYQTLVDKGYFESSPEAVRSRFRSMFLAIPFIGIAIAVIICIAVGAFTGWAVFPVIVGVVIGMVASRLSKSMPRKTRSGAEAAAMWNAFRKYLDDIEKRENLEESTAIFQKYIAYAVAFGLEHSWVTKFTRVQTPVPDWWSPVFIPSGSSPSDRNRRLRPGRSYRTQPGQGGSWIFGDSSSPSDRGHGFDIPGWQESSDRAGKGLQSGSDGFFEMLGKAASALGSSSGGGSFGSSRGGGFSGGGGRSSGGGGGGGRRGFR